MEYVVDASLLTTEEKSHEYLKEVFDFPDYYGNNLDALYDCLTDLSDSTVEFVDREFAGAYFEPVLEVFLDASLDNDSLYIIT